MSDEASDEGSKVLDVELNEVGLDYWYSFLWPDECVYKTEELLVDVVEDFENERTANEMEHAVIFQ